MFYGQTISAAFVAAVGLAFPMAASPLPYTSETSCFVLYFDGTTSRGCDGFWAEATIQFAGAGGSNRVFAAAGSAGTAYIFPDEAGAYENGWGATSSTVTANLSFTGITPGPIRTGMVEIFLDSEGVGDWEGGMGGDISLSPGIPSCYTSGRVCGVVGPFTLGVPFSFELETAASMECPGACLGAGKIALVQMTICEADGKPVPIYATSAVPEPNHLAFIGLALISGAYAFRRAQG
jgi:hypothetical protein